MSLPQKEDDDSHCNAQKEIRHRWDSNPQSLPSPTREPESNALPLGHGAEAFISSFSTRVA